MQLFKRRKIMSNLPIAMDCDDSDPPFGTNGSSSSSSSNNKDGTKNLVVLESQHQLIIQQNTASANRQSPATISGMLSPHSPDGKFFISSTAFAKIDSEEERFSNTVSTVNSAHDNIKISPTYYQQQQQHHSKYNSGQFYQSSSRQNASAVNQQIPSAFDENTPFTSAAPNPADFGVFELIQAYARLSTCSQDVFLTELLQNVSTRQLSLLSNLVMPRLKVDIVRNLPKELSLHILSFLPVNSLCRLSCVSRYHSELVNDSHLWRTLCRRYRYSSNIDYTPVSRPRCFSDAPTRSLPALRILTPIQSTDLLAPTSLDLPPIQTTDDASDVQRSGIQLDDSCDDYDECNATRGRSMSFKLQFKKHFMTRKNWRTGRCTNRFTANGPKNAIVTTLMFDETYLIMGTDNTTFGDIQVFDPCTGKIQGKLTGHEGGVWALDFIGNTLVSGGCDRDLRVWDLPSGLCKFRLDGHSSTIRCLKMIDESRALTGSRDHTVRLWDIAEGKCLHVFRGHSASIRCLAVHGNLVVSGSYDNTLRIWNLDTKTQVHLLNAHHAQIYSVDFNGKYVCSGSLDADVRVWDAATGRCLYTLEGHDALVGHVQIYGDLLATAGSDGRVCIWNLETGELLRYINAYLTAVSALQFDEDYIVTGGDDGIKIWDVRSGQLIRKALDQATGVWRLQFSPTKLISAIQNGETTSIEIMDYEPHDLKE